MACVVAMTGLLGLAVHLLAAHRHHRRRLRPRVRVRAAHRRRVAPLTVSIPLPGPGPHRPTAIRQSAQWSLVLLLVALIAGYARRISGEADRQHSLALDRLGRLADANALLFSLHRVTQTLPASLDLDDVLDTTVGRLRGLFDFDFAAILVFDDTDGDWQLVRREGRRPAARRATSADDLPAPLRRVASTSRRSSASPTCPTPAVRASAPKASSGLYAVLPARGLASSACSPSSTTDDDHFSDRDVELLNGFVEPVALAIDNARWFGRLRTVGADEERTRIARDLHDRIGQSLAYLAFELDRIVTSQRTGDDLGASLEQLRDDVRGVIREVRDTLYDLRTDVSDSQDMADDPRGLRRPGPERSEPRHRAVLRPRRPAAASCRSARCGASPRRRSPTSSATPAPPGSGCCGAATASRPRSTSPTTAPGFPIGTAGRLDSYGILGMRERASSIGATLDITSEPGKGTRVRCTLLRAAPTDDAARGTVVSRDPMRAEPRRPRWPPLASPVWLACADNRALTRAAHAPRQRGYRVSIRLMLADDHRMLREGLRRSMTDQGFDVVGEARDGDEAIRLAEELQPEVILMDVTMPEVDGVEATRQIRLPVPRDQDRHAHDARRPGGPRRRPSAPAPAATW